MADTVAIPQGATIGDASAGVPIPQGATIGDSQPRFAARASQQFGLTQHPIDQLISELTQLKNHPIDTLWETVKQPVIGLRDLANNLVRHPIDTVQQVTGGKQFAQDVQSGNYSGALGTLAGAGAQAAMMKGPKATLTAPVEGVAEKMYTSALKPSVASYSAREVTNMARTGLDAAVPVSEKGAAKLNGLIADLRDSVQGEIKAGAKAGATVDPGAVATRADSVKSRFMTQVNPESDIAAIDSSKGEFLRNNPNPLPVDQAQQLKSGTYTQLRKKYGELGSASTEAQKALARGLKEELETQFPEIKDLNAREARYINLDEALDRAVRRINNHQIFGIGSPIAAGAAKAVSGSTPIGAAAFVLKWLIDDPGFKSRLAIALNTAAKGGVALGGAQARIAGYSSALARAASAGTPTNQTNQPAASQ